MATTPFTTRAMIESRLSAVGVALRVDHVPNAALAEAIAAATEDVFFIVNSRYADADVLADNRWIQSITTNLAVIYLSSWRNNPVPRYLTDRWEKDEAHLNDIRQGKYDIPGLSLGLARAPQLVHVTVNYGYTRSIRVTYQGTTNRPRGYVRRIDYTEPTGP